MNTTKLTSLTCILALTFGSFSTWAIEESPSSESPVVTAVPAELTPADATPLESGGVCLQNFKKRRDGFAVGTAVTPAIGAGAVVGGAYAGGLIGAVALSNQGGGWGALVVAVLGIEFGAFTVAATTVGLEIFLAVELAKAEKMYQLVRAVEAGSGKAIDRNYKKFIRKHKELKEKVTQEDFTKQIFEWNQSHALCDGSLKTKKPKPNESRLKKLLVTPKELDRALVKEFSARQ